MLLYELKRATPPTTISFPTSPPSGFFVILAGLLKMLFPKSLPRGLAKSYRFSRPRAGLFFLMEKLSSYTLDFLPPHFFFPLPPLSKAPTECTRWFLRLAAWLLVPMFSSTPKTNFLEEAPKPPPPEGCPLSLMLNLFSRPQI